MGNIKYDENVTKQIIDLYESGLSQRQVAKIIGCSHRLVTVRLAENNIKQREKGDYAKQFDDSTENSIIMEYNSGMSLRELADKYGCSTMPIVSLFKRRGLKLRGPNEKITKYHIDKNYFDNIDTQEKAYILGYLYADGWNTSIYEHGHYIIGMTLHNQDAYILYRISELMNSNYPIKDFKNRYGNYYKQWYFCNKYLVMRLDELGITPRKSKTTVFPDWLNENLIPHFLRGLFDGDGSISSDLQYVNLVGSDSLINSIYEFIYKKFGIMCRKYSHHVSDGISQIFINKGMDKLDFLDYIYNGATIKLERKYNLYCDMKKKYVA